MAGQEELGNILLGLSYEQKQKTQQDVVQCINKYKNLRYREAFLIHDDGQESMMLCLGGTIPMNFKGTVYNIPVDIFVPRLYPLASPIVYVRPTSTMDVKPNSQVAMNGRVTIPFLSQWSQVQDLVTLCDLLSVSFGHSPPVYAKDPRRPTATAVATTTTTTPTSRVTSVSNPPPTYDTVVSPEEPDSRQVSSNKLTKKLQEHLEQFYTSIGKEMDAEYAKQAQLQKNKETIRLRQFEFEESVVVLEEQCKLASDSIKSLETWLDERKGNDDGELNLDQVIQPSDEASEKLLELVSETAAIDDTLFALDRALNQGAIELPAFLREVRKLSRQQFLHIAHSQKIVEHKKSDRPPKAHRK